jgi:hypothetical protein
MDFGHAAAVALTSGVVSGVTVAFVTDRLERGRRDAAVREARRNEAARIVGPALASLRDIEPGSNIGVLRGHARASDALKEKWEAWLSASGELEVLGATHPGSQVDERCQSVITKGTQLLNGIHTAVILDDGPLPDREWNRLKGLYADAIADARQLVKDVLNQPAS